MATQDTDLHGQLIVKRGFNVPCIKCSDTNTVSVGLGNVTKFYCNGCDAEYTVVDVIDLMAKWDVVLRWIALAPEIVD